MKVGVCFRRRNRRLRRCRRGKGRCDLLGPSAHLPALPLQPAHPLLAPLCSHLRGFGRAARETENVMVYVTLYTLFKSNEPLTQGSPQYLRNHDNWQTAEARSKALVISVRCSLHIST